MAGYAGGGVRDLGRGAGAEAADACSGPEQEPALFGGAGPARRRENVRVSVVRGPSRSRRFPWGPSWRGGPGRRMDAARGTSESWAAAATTVRASDADAAVTGRDARHEPRPTVWAVTRYSRRAARRGEPSLWCEARASGLPSSTWCRAVRRCRMMR